MTKTRKALLNSIISLILCFSMLLGTTYAWFTDTASSHVNTIQSGTLKVALEDEAGNDLEGKALNFQKAQGHETESILWEPGVTYVTQGFRVVNRGNLALKYRLALTGLNGDAELLQAIEFWLTDDPTAPEVNKLDLSTFEASLEKEASGVVYYLVGHMSEDAGNEYQDKRLEMNSVSIAVYATQHTAEFDSFDDQYDAGSKWPGMELPGGNVSESVGVNVENGVVKDKVTVGSGEVSATVPAGVAVNDGTAALTLSVAEKTDSDSNVTVEAHEALMALDVHIEGVSADNTTPIIVKLGKALPVGLNLGNVSLYHVENGSTNKMERVMSLSDLDEHNEFYYDPATGEVTVAMATFSEVAMVADTENAWKGKFDYTWYDASKTELTIASADQLAAFGAIVGGMDGQTQNSFSGKTVKLLADINLGYGVEGHKYTTFYPIGYYNSTGSYEKVSGGSVTSEIYSFEGTFDGNGHTIKNFYQNTWEMFGDYNDGYSGTPNHYKDAMGLFGYVVNGKVCNLTVDNFSSDGEFTPTGVIAAYADGDTIFENIAITNCNPRVYNTGNGGIIGIAGSTSAANDDHITLKNITVDNSNKISALWGSWDVACGGLVGMYRGNVDGSGNATGDTISFENCHVAAQIDVYNDVCANYQYYAYRYAGMMIGSVRHNTTSEGKTIPNMTGISATGCTVNYGDWNDYYYCEFEKNTIASYSEDYQFSRVPHSELNFTDSNGNGVVDADERASVTGCKHTHTAEEDKQAVYLPFHQLFTGYSWGVSSIGLKEYSGIVTDLGITEGDQEESVEKFETKFTGDFLYRVGNQNEVPVGTLFKSTVAVSETDDGINDPGVWVTVEPLNDDMNVSGTFTANTTDWTKGTIQFSGTGVVKVTIQDYNFCTPTELILEVVDAKNATSAASATANNVVLLNDTSGTFTVSNGYTFYGNGFTVTLPNTAQSKYSAGYVGLVTITNGNLDNVIVEGPVYPQMNIYREQAQDASDTTKANYFYNSILINGGNCTIANSKISGARAAICIRGANNVTIDNTTVSGGAVANIEIAGASTVTLRDLTTVQTDKTDSYEQGKTAHGMGVYISSGVCKIYIEDTLTQRNWVNEEQWKALVGAYDKFFPDFFGDDQYVDYQKEIEGKKYVNLAMVFACNWDEKYLDTRKQSNVSEYQIMSGVEMQGYTGGVYSVTGTTPTATDLKEPEYQSVGYNPIIPTFQFDNASNNDPDDANDAGDTYCVYNENSGTLKIGVSGDSKTIDLSGVSVTKNGAPLAHTACLNGTQISGNSVTIEAADGAKQTLTFEATSNDAGYDKDGNPIVGSIEYTWTVTVEMAVLSYPAPVWNMGGDYQFDTSNCVYAYYGTSNGYGEAVPIYEGIKINYYDKSGNLVKLDLSGTTEHPTGSANSNSNAFTYTLGDGSTLTMKFSSGWKSGATTHQFTTYDGKVYIYPQSLDNDNYIRAKTTNQDFDVKITYTFTDPNGQSTGAQTMQWYNAKASNGSVSTVQWKTFDSTNGKETECIVEGSLITMADGTQKPVEDLAIGDMLLVFNHITGKLEASPLIFNTHSDENETKNYKVLHLEFSNGEEVKIVASHGFFDMTLMQYVYITYDNYTDYIGHEFYTIDGETVELTNAYVAEELTRIFCPVTYFHMNSFANGMLNTPNIPGDITGLVNYFEYDSDLKYNEEAMQRDIEKYGLYTYDDFSDYISEAAYHSSPAVHLKVAVGKGMITFEEILDVIDYLLAGSLIH